MLPRVDGFSGLRSIVDSLWLWLLSIVFILLTGFCQQGVAADPEVDFNRQIRPLLAKHCYSCHGPDQAESGLRLTDLESATKTVDSGEVAIVPGDPQLSELIKRVTAEDESIRMPPEGDGLKPAEVEILTKWIAEGAEYTRHWSFQPIRQIAMPNCDDSDWCSNPIDRFLLHAMESAEIEPNVDASAADVIRRVYYNLLGVPPSPVEIRAFETDTNDSAYERLVDRLLSDPRMGERWGRHWLDVVRYAETNSFERDGPKPNAWRYRDYVIQSFNEDKPYDTFLTEQLAGDEIASPTVESLTATGFYRLGIWDDEPADPLQAQFDEYDDLVTVTGQGILGLTFNCARCHDHKIDPIPQTDYYQMVAFFRDVPSYGTRRDQKSNNQVEITPEELREQYRKIDQAKSQVDDEIHALEQIVIKRMPGELQRLTEGDDRDKTIRKHLAEHFEGDEASKYESLQSQAKDLVRRLKSLPEREFVLGLAKCDPNPPATHVLLRGSPLAEGDVVQPGFPALVGEPPPAIPRVEKGAKSSGRRRQLAEWIVDDRNWFTARVIVNRLWQHHFGRGIVRSSNNFGQLGDSPTHPELLDWLATELIRNDWSLKAIHRSILMSHAYRISSAHQDVASAKDPANNLFWQFPMRRLSAEELRDSVLVATGDINYEKFGPSIYPEIADEVKATQSKPGQGWDKSSESDKARRSVYIYIKRSLIPPELSVFDFPETDASCEGRFLTTQPAQSLGLLNGAFLQGQAIRFSDRVLREAGTDWAQQVRQAIRLAYGREASDTDIVRANELYEDLGTRFKLTPKQRLKEYCLVLLNTNEFLYLD